MNEFVHRKCKVSFKDIFKFSVVDALVDSLQIYFKKLKPTKTF